LLYSPLLGLGRFSVSWSYTQSVGLIGRGDRPVARPLPTHRTTQTESTHTMQISMSWVGFKPTIPAFKRAKTVHALDRAASVIGPIIIY
jgi:hypothetical protein